MKKLNLDNIDHQASFFIYLVNKSRFEVALAYNTLAASLAANQPLSEIEEKLAEDFPGLCSNALALSSILQRIDTNFDYVSYCSESIEITEHIQRSLEAVGSASVNPENQTAFLARALTLLGMVFGDVQRLEKVFVGMCHRTGISYDLLMSWTDDEEISVDAEESYPQEG